MPDILLIQPPIEDFYITSKRTIPYGLACIAASLIKDGFSVEILDSLASSKSHILDLPSEMDFLKKYYGSHDLSPVALFSEYKHYGYSFEHIGKVAKNSNAFLTGISSLFTAYSDEALEAARIVKNYNPETTVVLGGHHPTALPQSVLAYPFVDYVLRGEGEVSMSLIAKAIKSGKQGESLKQIPGICFKTGAGEFYISDPAVMQNLDDYLYPSFKIYKNPYYRRSRRYSMAITASRGCPMRCSYCSLGNYSPFKYRKRKVDLIIREIKEAISCADVGLIDFEDENLSFDKKWFLKLLKKITIIFSGLDIELRAMNGLFPGSLDEETIHAMKCAGFKTLNLSLCSINKDRLKDFNRPDVTDEFDKSLELAEKYGLSAVGYIIAGAPEQTSDESIYDLIYLAQRRVLAGLSVFYPSPGSKDYNKCKQLGVLPITFSLMRSSALPVSHTTDRLEAVTILRLARMLNFIKSLIDRNEKLPEPEPFSQQYKIEIQNRHKSGLQLLKWFLADGKIRGITREGDIYEHHVSERLAQKFIKELDLIKVRGVKYLNY